MNSVFHSQEIHLILWENKVRNRIQIRRPLVPILSQTNLSPRSNKSYKEIWCSIFRVEGERFLLNVG